LTKPPDSLPGHQPIKRKAASLITNEAVFGFGLKAVELSAENALEIHPDAFAFNFLVFSYVS
jgi:hypothetical protein